MLGMTTASGRIEERQEPAFETDPLLKWEARAVGRSGHRGSSGPRMSRSFRCVLIASPPFTGAGYSPVRPSRCSRTRSAWPLWRAYSSIMWVTIQRREYEVSLPSGAR